MTLTMNAESEPVSSASLHCAAAQRGEPGWIRMRIKRDMTQVIRRSRKFYFSLLHRRTRPIFSHQLPPSHMASRDAPVLVHRSSSSSSTRSLSSFVISSSSLYRTPPSHPQPPDFDYKTSQTDVSLFKSTLAEEGVRHVDAALSTKRYKTPEFGTTLLQVIQSLQVSSWTSAKLSAAQIHIHKVSGSLTNAVFFVSYRGQSAHPPRTLLLRIYGASSDQLVSRSTELRILHVLSSQYRIGPRIYGTFRNGRIEEYFESDALTPHDMRQPHISSWIGRRMRELHHVEIQQVLGSDVPRTLAVMDNVAKWLAPARAVLELVPWSGIDLDRFEREWTAYLQKVFGWEAERGESPRVFAHNDAQYGNLLRLRNPPRNAPPHHQIIVVDYEYASLNPAAFDIANHFHEWTTDYNSATPHLLNLAGYPSLEERLNFYRAYLGSDAGIEELDGQVQMWSAASHGMWGVWAIVQAREQVESGDGGEFDYLGYAMSRLMLFYGLQ